MTWGTSADQFLPNSIHSIDAKWDINSWYNYELSETWLIICSTNTHTHTQHIYMCTHNHTNGHSHMNTLNCNKHSWHCFRKWKWHEHSWITSLKIRATFIQSSIECNNIIIKSSHVRITINCICAHLNTQLTTDAIHSFTMQFNVMMKLIITSWYYNNMKDNIVDKLHEWNFDHMKSDFCFHHATVCHNISIL